MRRLSSALLALAALLSLVAQPALADTVGAVQPGNAASQSDLQGCIYETSPAAAANGQQRAVHCDQYGSAAVAVDGVDDGATQTASLSSSGTLLTLNTAGYGYIELNFSSAGSGNTFAVDSANDPGPTWGTQVTYPFSLAAGATSFTISSGVPYLVPVTGSQMRIRVVSYTSGTVTVYATLKRAAAPIPAIVQDSPYYAGVGAAAAATAGAEGTSNTLAAPYTYSRDTDYNGAGWDRKRSNEDFGAILNQTSVSGGTTSSDQVNYNGNCAVFFVNISAMSGTSPTLTVSIQQKDTVSGNYYTVLQSAAFSTTGFNPLTVCPGATPSANITAAMPLTRTYRVSTSIGGTTPSISYTVSVSLVGR